MSSEESHPKTLENVAADALQPVADQFARYQPREGRLETGEALAGIANIAANKAYSAAEAIANLASFKTVITGWHYVEEHVIPLIRKKVEAIPEEDRRPPPLLIAGPVLENSKFTAEEPVLAEMFATLLASSMDAKTQSRVHPSYVEIIKQLTSEEARIINFLGQTDGSAAVVDLKALDTEGDGYTLIWRNFSYVGRDAGNPMDLRIALQISSLERLGLISIPAGLHLINTALYIELEQAPELEPMRKQVIDSGRRIAFERRFAALTVLGMNFYDACVRKADM